MTTYTLAQLAQCARRELGFRKHVYPKQVQKGRMSTVKAEAEIAMMEQIADRLRDMVAAEKAEREPDIFRTGGAI